MPKTSRVTFLLVSNTVKEMATIGATCSRQTIAKREKKKSVLKPWQKKIAQKKQNNGQLLT